MNSEFENRLNTMAEKGLLTYIKEKSLSACSSFRIGGPAAYAVYPTCAEGLANAYYTAKLLGVKAIVMGSCTNVLFPDEGYDGAVIFTTGMNKARFYENKVQADAGIGLTALAVKAQKKGLSGLEFGYGIPGSVGGAVYMNAGAYDHAVDEILVRSRYFDPESGVVRAVEGNGHEFAYRHSFYTGKDYVILDTVFELTPSDPDEIKAQMDDYMERRKSKQPLEYPSAGSVFKRYPGYFTAKLIDEAGLKGRRVGGAQISEKHAGFIVNLGGATASDVKALIECVKEEIFRRNGIMIEQEIICVR